ncbi:cupin domain-containing protein [Lysobacter panacisoli]|uniref:Cupin type-2 domain-containing protein n=1 Tax=Lysobacter panacisoli TaxID=1255263 RepID=A0ABP9LSX3_9GAMM|nr:cupin domain-containing protein [Lysobacter panacisoli]
MRKAVAFLLAGVVLATAYAGEPRRDSYVQQARGIAVQQPGPHEGQGTTTAYPFFEDAEGFDIVFRQRALHPGATIGEHRNDKDEIYYVLSGRGELLLDGKRRDVGPGDAILTRDGSTHALAQRGSEDLVIIVVYRKRATAPASTR